MGQLLRRNAAGDELLAEWSPGDPDSVAAAEAVYRDHLSRDYEAVRSDGIRYEPIHGDVFPADAAQVILTTAMGGG